MNQKINYWVAPLLALVLLISGCSAGGPNLPSTAADGSLPAATLPPLFGDSQSQLPTLVPTISLPTAAVSTVVVTPPVETDGVGTPPVEPSTGAMPVVETAAPQVQPAAPGQPVDAACLVGTWEVADLPQAMSASLDQSGAGLELDEVQGRALYQFSADGGVQIRYEGLSAALSGVVEGMPVSVLQTLDGSGSARYTLNPSSGEMLMTDFGGDGIQSKLVVNGQTLAEGSLPVWQAIAGRLSGTDPNTAAGALNQTRAAVACSGDQLTIRAIEPVASPEVRLVRVP